MVTIVKVDLSGDLRRFHVELPADADAASKFALVLDQVRRGYQLPEGAELTLKYSDEEGDLCTLTEATIADCLLQAPAGPLRLVASSPPAAPAGEPDPVDPERLLEMIRQLALRPEKLLEMADLLLKDPAKLFGIVQAFKPFWLLLKTCKGKGRGKCKGKWGWWSCGQEEGAPEGEGASGWPGPCAWSRCAWKRQEGAKKHEAGKCPAGHELTLQLLPRGTCDACGAQIAEGDAAVGCRECNWDLCWGCAEREGAADAAPEEGATPASDSVADAKAGSGDDWDLCDGPPPTGASEAAAEADCRADAEPTDQVPQGESAPEDPWACAMGAFKGKGKGKFKGKWPWAMVAQQWGQQFHPMAAQQWGQQLHPMAAQQWGQHLHQMHQMHQAQQWGQHLHQVNQAQQWGQQLHQVNQAQAGAASQEGTGAQQQTAPGATQETSGAAPETFQ